MSWKRPTKHSWSLAGRLTTWYTLASIVLTMLTTGILYWGLAASLARSAALFLADKGHVLRAILRDRPGDIGGLKEEVELESEARLYAHFYVRLLDDHGQPSLTTPGMDGLLPIGLFSAPIPPDVEPGRGVKLR